MKAKIVMRDGLPLMVIRPADPEKAIRIAKEAAEANDAERLANLVDEVGADTYTFVGYATHGKRIVDESGKPIGETQPGDSFVTVRLTN